MDFGFTPRMQEWSDRVKAFMDEKVFPAEETYYEQVQAGPGPHHPPPILEELKAEARSRGLWNLFLPSGGAESDGRHPGAGLTNLEYAPLAEQMGWVSFASETMNCSAPDTGNMELLTRFGTPEQKERWLVPLLAGEIRSGFSMTEPDVASSDATNIQSRIIRDGDMYVINGRKWFTTGALDPRCGVLIFMGKTDPDTDPYHQQSMVLVPRDHPGIKVSREISVFGYHDRGGHPEMLFEDVRVPVENLLGAEGDGFRLAQERLGPGRIHHCMRAIGLAERALQLMCLRSLSRHAFGKELAGQGVVQDWIAEARIQIEQTRLLVLKAAWMMDTVGNKAARQEISAIKVLAARLATTICDRAVQLHGAAGVSQVFPLSAMYAHARTLHLADGPDEVHKMVIARRELRRYTDARL